MGQGDQQNLSLPQRVSTGTTSVVGYECNVCGLTSFTGEDLGSTCAHIGTAMEGTTPDGTVVAREEGDYFGNLRSVAAGNDFSMALDNYGQVWAWGNNTYGQVGVNSSGEDVLAPTQVGGFASSSEQLSGPNTPYKLDNVLAIAAGGRHAVALTYGGAVYTWGDNDYGQLGIGDTSSRSTYHAREVLSEDLYAFSHDHRVTAIAARDAHTLLLTDDGQVWAMGYNYYGRLGVGDETSRYYPTKVLTTNNMVTEPITNVTGISAGATTSSQRQWFTPVLPAVMWAATLTAWVSVLPVEQILIVRTGSPEGCSTPGAKMQTASWATVLMPIRALLWSIPTPIRRMFSVGFAL